MKSSLCLEKCKRRMFLRYAGKNLVPHEKFTSLYEFVLTTGKNLAKIVLDVLQHLNLWHMKVPKILADKYNGAQAVGPKSQFLAPYSHCANLITQRACTVSVFMQNSLNWDHDLDVFRTYSSEVQHLRRARVLVTV